MTERTPEQAYELAKKIARDLRAERRPIAGRGDELLRRMRAT